MAWSFPDVLCWIKNLSPISEWETSTMALNICSPSSSSLPFLYLTITKNHHSPKLSFVISAVLNTPVPLWTSKPWKFEESVYGFTANLNWFLHDSTDGKEVLSSKPSKCALLNPKSWFKNRYSSAHRPIITREGGVTFAGDEYGQKMWWQVDKSTIGKTTEWEIRGWIWLTYWPNKHVPLYNETRRLEFREIVLAIPY
ncbi:uncharacterized protein LOC133317232 [Gastrolobium bilobum]|uniref:uncharacterized protein LOC133317232 n=1 Tax=Gastrolobium bilobum TaxID=150636 RepID=UPI002AB0DE3D|nr:uncharacterized protein LOC133317232 [Gastrolobium bilobum]